MSDIAPAVASADRQPRRALSSRGFGSRERILKRCRELMLAGKFRPTTKELETATLTPKVIRYYFDTQEGLYEAALDAVTAYAIARVILGGAPAVTTDDVARLARAAVFGRLADPDRWKSHYRFAGGNMSAGIERLNQRWQIDASPSDALCVDARYSIYVVIDLYSRRMMGLVTRTPRTTASLLLIKHACEAWGVPEVIVTDNGSDFKSLHFVDALRRLGVRSLHLADRGGDARAVPERRNRLSPVAPAASPGRRRRAVGHPHARKGDGRHGLLAG